MCRPRSIIVSAAFLASSLVHASPMSYEFTTNWYEGKLTGVTSKGYFTYDSSRVEAGKTLETLNLFTDFDFSFRNVHYTEATVNTAQVSFSETGDLQSVVFGTDCYFSPLADGGKVGTCAAYSDRLEGFFIQYNASHPLYAAAAGDGEDPFVYPGFSSGTTTVRLLQPDEIPAQVPEPDVALMFLSGLTLLGAICIRKSKASRFPR